MRTRQDDRSIDTQTAGILSHPLVAPFVAERFADGEIILERVLDELALYGEVSVVSAGAHSEVALSRRQRVVVATPWSSTTLAADGSTRLLAALRCLMELLTEIERQARHTVDDLDSFRADF